jgi:hypothetical protein
LQHAGVRPAVDHGSAQPVRGSRKLGERG